MRARRRVADRLVADGGLALRLPYDGPLDWDALLAYFAARAIPGVEHVDGDTYRRTVVVDGDPGVLELQPGGPDHLVLRAHLPHWEGLIHLVRAHPAPGRARRRRRGGPRRLAADPVIGPLVERRPGLRVPGRLGPLRDRRAGHRRPAGDRAPAPARSSAASWRAWARRSRAWRAFGLTHTFPDATTVAEADLGGLGFTGARADAIRTFARAVADDAVRLDRSVGLDDIVAAISAQPGLGAWTAQYLALRLGEPDAFPAGDLGLRRAFGAGTPVPPAALESAAEAWRPWRALAAVHLWTAGAGQPPSPHPAPSAVWGLLVLPAPEVPHTADLQVSLGVPGQTVTGMRTKARLVSERARTTRSVATR